jgi:hypothetical protein
MASRVQAAVRRNAGVAFRDELAVQGHIGFTPVPQYQPVGAQHVPNPNKLCADQDRPLLSDGWSSDSCLSFYLLTRLARCA